CIEAAGAMNSGGAHVNFTVPALLRLDEKVPRCRPDPVKLDFHIEGVPFTELVRPAAVDVDKETGLDEGMGDEVLKGGCVFDIIAILVVDAHASFPQDCQPGRLERAKSSRWAAGSSGYISSIIS